MGRVAVVLLTVAVTSSSLRAQDTASVYVGDRIRISAPPHLSDTTVGVVSSVTPTAFGLLAPAPASASHDTLFVPFTAIDHLEVRRSGSFVLRGLATGALVGGSLGLLAGTVLRGCAAEECVDADPVARRVLRLGLAGGALGLVVGTIARWERWEIAPAFRFGDYRPTTSSISGGLPY